MGEYIVFDINSNKTVTCCRAPNTSAHCAASIVLPFSHKWPRFLEGSLTTPLIWNDLCQVTIFGYFVHYSTFFLMTLQGAGCFDDVSV